MVKIHGADLVYAYMLLTMEEMDFLSKTTYTDEDGRTMVQRMKTGMRVG